MEEKDLLQRVQKGDEAAFRALFHTYAEPAYQLLLQKCGDKALARALLKRVFEDVYRGLKEREDADPTALWINALAEKRIDAHLFYQKETNAVWQTLSSQPALPQAAQPGPGEVPLPPEPVPVQPVSAAASTAHAAGPARKRRGGRAALLCVLVAMTVCVLWVMAGLLMDVQALPKIDLGYDWFNTAVFHLF